MEISSGINNDAAYELDADTVFLSAENVRISIPGNLWLEHAKFEREGPDLVLVGQDGAKIVIADYFRTEPTPA